MIARRSQGEQELCHDLPSSSPSSSSGASRVDSDVEQRQESNDSVSKEDVDLHKDEREKPDPVEEKSNATLDRSRERQDDDDRDNKRQRLSFRSNISLQAATCRSFDILGLRQEWRIGPDERSWSECHTRSSEPGPARRPPRSDGWTV